MTDSSLRDERELTAAVDLCLPDGRLNREAVGWSRNPLHRCNLPDSLARKKRWNYWCITSGDVLFSATIADVDLAQLAFVYVYDVATRQFAEKTVVAAPGTAPMPETPAGDIVFDHDDMRVVMTDDGAGTRIRVDCGDFRGLPLRANLLVERSPDHETLNVVIPWDDEQFQFTSKQNTLPASGEIAWGEHSYALGKDAYGCLDFGRGVWPRETRWNWGAASGRQAGTLVGLNLGGGWTDGTGMTENAICLDGRLSKVSEDLRFEYLHDDLMAPWRVTSAATDRVDLRFTPVYERVAKGGNDAYFSEVHQLLGHYDGGVTADGGESIAIQRLFGWIESHDARW